MTIAWTLSLLLYFYCFDSIQSVLIFVVNVSFMYVRTMYVAHMKDKSVLSELLLTIATLTVRHEFCVQVEEAGGLKFINDCMVNR